VFLVDPKDTTATVTEALEVGYRHIDTAQMYRNEKETGDAIHAFDLDREEVFITSKLNNGHHRPDDARKAFDETLASLRIDYVNLFLIHWPLPTLYDGDFVSTWRTLEEFKRDGRARSIGVSNFQIPHLERLRNETDTVPAVNQIEVHPHFCNEAVRAYNREHGIITEAWSPLKRGQIFGEPAVSRIAEKAGKTEAQVVLRWHLQRGDVIFPKTLRRSRMKENFALFDFEIQQADMDLISSLDQGEAGRYGPNPDTFDMIPK
jgi:2,5-diketo-D-gluconate reductase A